MAITNLEDLKHAREYTIMKKSAMQARNTPLASQGLFFGDFAHDQPFIDARAFLEFEDELSEEEKGERDWWGRALCTGAPFAPEVKKTVSMLR